MKGSAWHGQECPVQVRASHRWLGGLGSHDMPIRWPGPVLNAQEEEPQFDLRFVRTESAVLW
jgi:hypothetical protein